MIYKFEEYTKKDESRVIKGERAIDLKDFKIKF